MKELNKLMYPFVCVCVEINLFAYPSSKTTLMVKAFGTWEITFCGLKNSLDNLNNSIHISDTKEIKSLKNARIAYSLLV